MTVVDGTLNFSFVLWMSTEQRLFVSFLLLVTPLHEFGVVGRMEIVVFVG